MLAIISDIHANLEALQAVLADAEKYGATEIICLGDVVGYGPDPIACLDLAMGFSMTLLGNHDQAVIRDPDGFPASAEQALFWTRNVIDHAGTTVWKRNNPFWDFLTTLPTKHEQGEWLYVHGSPRNPLNEYIFPEDIYNAKKMSRIFDLLDVYCFCGHTHVPGVFTERCEYSAPADLNDLWHTNAEKTIINVGSVGQPRDNDPRACYVLFDGETVRWRRVEYDIDAVVRKIYAIPELENFLGDRLREGR